MPSHDRSVASFKTGVIGPGRLPWSRLQGESSGLRGVTRIKRCDIVAFNRSDQTYPSVRQFLLTCRVPVRSGKYQAHVWFQGNELHLGNYEREKDAAQIHDIAALKLKGLDSCTNFPCNLYQEQLQQLKEMSDREVVQYLQSCGTGGRQQSSQYRGVSKHAKGKWEAKCMGRFLGLHEHETDAAKAYDRAAVRCKGQHARTNFDLADHQDLLDEREAKQLQHTPSISDALMSSSELVIQTWIPCNMFSTEVEMLQHTGFESMSVQPYRTRMQPFEDLDSNAVSRSVHHQFQMSNRYLQLSFAEMQQAPIGPSAHPLAMQQKLGSTIAEHDSTVAAHDSLCSDHLPQMAASFGPIAQPSSSTVARQDTSSSALDACDALSMDPWAVAALPGQHEQDFDAELDALLDVLDINGSTMTLEGPNGADLGL